MEHIRNEAAYHNANVKIVAVGGGFAYGQLGMSHHATEDVAMLRAIPNMTVLAPADSAETVEAVKLAAKIDGPVYIRLGRGGEKSINHNKLDITRLMGLNITHHNSSQLKIALIGSGIVMPDVEEAAVSLASEYNVSAYSLACIKPVDIEAIKKVCIENDYVFTIEEHQIIGGLGSLLAEVIAENNIDVAFRRIGLQDQFTQVVGCPAYLRRTYKIDKEGIITIVKNIVKINK